MTCGIYMIKNKINGKMYVGQSVNIEKRWREHCRGYYDGNRPISNAIKKYGKNNFEFTILHECKNDSDLLNKLEQHYIKKYNTYEDRNHYNLTPGGDFCPAKVPEIAKKISKAMSGENHPFYGKHFTKEHKRKISEANKGRVLSQETRRKISEANKGKVISQEMRKKLSEINKGKHHTLEARKKISEAEKGEKNHFYGKHFTEEHREKLSRARNKTGYYRVCKQKAKWATQGFNYNYYYYDDNKKRKRISSVDINKLEKKVKDKGLPWKKL